MKYLFKKIFCFFNDFFQIEQANNGNEQSGPSEEQLSLVYEKLKENLPMLFVSPLDYRMYTNDIVFENRIRGKTYQ